MEINKLFNELTLAKAGLDNAKSSGIGLERAKTVLTNILLSEIDDVIKAIGDARDLAAKVADLTAEVELREAEIGDMLAEKAAKAAKAKPKGE
jgi:hypothetical protein